jgi:hypothetical protein
MMNCEITMENELIFLICNIPLLRAHVIDLFFEDTCVQVIRFQYMDVCSLMDSYDDVDGL